MIPPTERFVMLISSEIEWRVLKRILPNVSTHKSLFGEYFHAQLGNFEVVFFFGGWGKVAAAASTQYVIDHLRPELLINIGTCGGFDESLQQGDIVLPNKTIIYDIVEQMGDPNEAIDAYSVSMDIAWINSDTIESVRQCVLVSGDRDIMQSDIAVLRQKYGAIAADWESGAIAWTAQKNGLSALILRGVSDIITESEALAYGNMAHFEKGTGDVMERLLKIIPRFLQSHANRQTGDY